MTGRRVQRLSQNTELKDTKAVLRAEGNDRFGWTFSVFVVRSNVYAKILIRAALNSYCTFSVFFYLPHRELFATYISIHRSVITCELLITTLCERKSDMELHLFEIHLPAGMATATQPSQRTLHAGFFFVGHYVMSKFCLHNKSLMLQLWAILLLWSLSSHSVWLYHNSEGAHLQTDCNF